MPKGNDGIIPTTSSNTLAGKGAIISGCVLCVLKKRGEGRMALTTKQQRFCDAYMANGGNAYQAALEAGYSKSTALDANDWVRAPQDPKKPHKKYRPELGEYIAANSTELARHNDKIATAEELQEFTSAVVRGEINEVVALQSGMTVEVPAGIKDRLKAVDLLAKMKGMYTTKIDADIREVVIIDDF